MMEGACNEALELTPHARATDDVAETGAWEPISHCFDGFGLAS